ncbi:MAG: hypothetical protein ACKVX7_00340 [Planctomycetota bacterium]
MALFKSREERRIEREIEVRKGVNLIRRNIRNLERNETDYLQKAKRAHQLGSQQQAAFLKQTLKRTTAQRRMMERQLLSIETAVQIKNQAESHAQFARAMNAVSRGIAEAFGNTDLVATQRDFEQAMAKAQSMEERMDVFLDMTSGAMNGYEGAGDEVVTDAEIDRMVADEVLAEESTGELDQNIQQGLADVRQELKRKVSG